jgi:TonB-dependent starch-binding outer membrane protein SusC
MENALCKMRQPGCTPLTKTILRVMQLTATLFLGICLHVSAATVSQTITFSGKDVKLEKVFAIVEQQTGFLFYYNPAEIENANAVTISASKLPIHEFLSEAFESQPLEFIIKANTVFVKGKSVAPADLHLLLSALDPPPVTGFVRGVDGQPLAGVNVMIKGKKKGTVSGADGKFTIEAQEGEVLLFSSVGYTPRHITVDEDAQFNSVVMAISESKLDEVQVKAYGTTSQRFSTSNISTVKAADIEKQPVSNPLLALQGRVPGIVIEQATGFANSGVAVRIQGQNSLRTGSDPLFIIDGTPISSRLPGNLGSILGGSSPSGTLGPPTNSVTEGDGNPLSFLNPADIESIDILKDAGATSIYGSRGGAGVVLITTKRGKAGQTRFDVNVQQGFGKVTRRLDVLNTQEYIEMRKEAFINDGLPVPDASTDPDLTNLDLTVWDQNRYTDWQKVLIGQNAEYTDVNGNVSGGNQNTQFLIGLGYKRQTAVFPGKLANLKGSGHFNITSSSPNKKLKIQFTGNYMIDNNRLIGHDLTEMAVRLVPNAPKLYNEDGSLNWEPMPGGATSSWRNPLAFMEKTVKIKTHNLIANMMLNYQISPSFGIQSNFGYTHLLMDGTQLKPLTVELPEERHFLSRETNHNVNNESSWSIEPQINFKHVLWKGTLEAFAGATIQSMNTRSFTADASGFSNDLLMQSLRSAPIRNVYFALREYMYNAGFLNINYNLSDKYLINLSGRRDGSSRFGSKNSVHNFGSVSGGWIFSGEDFVANTLPFLSFGKLKGSYGTTGSDQIGDYQVLDLYYDINSQKPYQNSYGLTPSNLPNPYLQWEETRKLSVGLDLGFLNDRIILNIVHFSNRSSNQLVNYDLPIVTGFGGITQNLDALIQNSGWEFVLNTVNTRSRNFTWSSSLNITLNRNKLLAFPDLANSSYVAEYEIGQPVNVNKRFSFVGVDPETGVYLVRDKHGKATTTPIFLFQPDTDANVVLNGHTPLFYGGFQNSLTYKGFEMDFVFQFVKQRSYYNRVGLYPGAFYGTSPYGNQPSWVLDRWQKPGDIATTQKYTTSFWNLNTLDNAAFSDGSIADGSYIRLKNASLSWQLPDRLKKAAHLQNLKLFFHGQNLLTITNFKGLDPETKHYGSLPPLRVLTFGMKITL